MDREKKMKIKAIMIVTAGAVLLTTPAAAQWQGAVVRYGPAVSNFAYRQYQMAPYRPMIQQFNRQYTYPAARGFVGWAGGPLRYETTPMYPRGFQPAFRRY